MRGIAHQPEIPTFRGALSAAAGCIAVYPMYKGLAQLVGMTKLEGPQTIAEQFERYLAEYDNYDFFFIHYKYTDMYGEDGNFAAKKKAIEEFDAALPILLQQETGRAGDHRRSFDAVRGERSLLASATGAAALGRIRGSDKLERFTETGANIGSLGVFEAKYLIRLMQANAKMFDKFGRFEAARSCGVRLTVPMAVCDLNCLHSWPNSFSTSKLLRCRWSTSTKRSRNICSANARKSRTNLPGPRAAQKLQQQFSLWPFTAQVVCIAMLNADTSRGQVLFTAEDYEEPEDEAGPVEFVPCVDEAELLTAFWDVAKHYETIVTFNGRGFDVPFIYLRSALLNVPISRKVWLGYRYQTEPHCDLAEQLTFYGVSGRDGAARRFNLDFYCKAFGIESPKATA